ncbi:aldo/keto reductase [Bacteroidia bacterium]|nr:aldo/keto reductase [Bacteroidia bacterium]
MGSMSKITLGRTGIVSDKTGFGALPMQRVSEAQAGVLLKKAYDSGITLFDTARMYSDSEKKIGLHLAHLRTHITITTKTMAKNANDFWNDLQTSLATLKTDYIDVYQLHNPPFCPKPGDESGLYDAMLEAQRQGKIRFIGITNHSIFVAEEAVQSGLYDTLQFPFSYLSTERETALARLCKAHNVGFIAMKALCGGLLTNAAAAYAYLNQPDFDNVLPIWGVQHESELDEFIGYMHNPPALTGELLAIITQDKSELAGNFCRGCGYCMPTCPAEIQINNCARMIQLIRRTPSAQWLTPDSQRMMHTIENCTECGICRTKCPYGIDTPALLKANLEDYKAVISYQLPNDNW